MGKKRKGTGGPWGLGAALMYKKELQEKKRAIQDAATPEDRERIEAAQQGREAFADSGRWGLLDQHGRSIEPEPTPVQKLQIQEPPKPTPTKTTTKKKKTTAKTTKAPTSTVAGSLGSTSGGSVSL